MGMSMSSGEMCSFFYQSMESAAAATVQGDLTDIFRGGIRSSAAPSGYLASTSGIDPRGSDQLQELSAKGCLLSPRPIKPALAVPVVVSAPLAPGVKGRKGQAKRVICIPAPASSADQDGSNKSSTSGIVVPSDLWAWRKYGQKPIKGSPYPRGYYRCSSSKGCSARKQVERSRGDPNMLVITYTSEHNHPWPTHRNSLAGSTRSSHPSKNQKNPNQPSPSSSKQEPVHDMSMLASTPPTEAIKEEDLDLGRVFDQSYAPMMLESKDMEFIDELGLDPDPMCCFFSLRELEMEEDPLSYFDNWDGSRHS